jgi:transcriptional regulator with XRE-family HTH domain
MHICCQVAIEALLTRSPKPGYVAFVQGHAAKLLRERRVELDLTQYEVAQRAGGGVREYDVSRWERGKTRSLPLLGLWKVSRVLGLDLEVVAEALLADEAEAQAQRARSGSGIRAE